MLKITGLDKLQRDLKDAQRALDSLGGELGTVNFDPHEPSSVEAAIQKVNVMVEDRLGRYATNPIVGPLIEQMKEKYRDGILKKAAEARLKQKEEE